MQRNENGLKALIRKISDELRNEARNGNSVKILKPNHGNGSVYISDEAIVQSNVLIMPGVCIFGNTVIGPNCTIWPGSVIINSNIREGCEIKSSWIVGADIGKDVIVGPFANIRPNTVVHDGVTIGTGAEIKNSTIGENSKIPHHCYIGDATIGANVNFSAGAITCNFDGEEKHKTEIGDNAFIGSGAEIIAPRKIGHLSYIAAGSVVTKDVPDDSLYICRGPKEPIIVRDWSRRKKIRRTARRS